MHYYAITRVFLTIRAEFTITFAIHTHTYACVFSLHTERVGNFCSITHAMKLYEVLIHDQTLQQSKRASVYIHSPAKRNPPVTYLNPHTNNLRRKKPPFPPSLTLTTTTQKKRTNHTKTKHKASQLALARKSHGCSIPRALRAPREAAGRTPGCAWPAAGGSWSAGAGDSEAWSRASATCAETPGSPLSPAP